MNGEEEEGQARACETSCRIDGHTIGVNRQTLFVLAGKGLGRFFHQNMIIIEEQRGGATNAQHYHQ